MEISKSHYWQVLKEKNAIKREAKEDLMSKKEQYNKYNVQLCG